MSRNLSDRRREFDSMVHGLRVVFFVLFALPLVIGAFILMAAVLNPGQGSVATVLVPNSYWKSLLSITARISLIPGFALLTHRALSSLRDRSREKRLAVILLSLVLLTVFAFMPSQQRPQVASTTVGSTRQQVTDVVYKADPQGLPAARRGSFPGVASNAPPSDGHFR